ncbi:MAG TPA: hypothetical protein VEV43_14575 [Actinomycetota bacterium]|nr:hypothetical protein [Actinomycetota bacterium]
MADPKIEKRPDVGVVFDVQRFERPGGDGVASGFQPTGPWDFPDGGYDHFVEHGVQKVRIRPAAPTNGDVGIERHFEVSPGDVYRLTARVRVARKDGAFKGRVNLSAREENGAQVEEFNGAQEEQTDTPMERTALAVVPKEARVLTARVKFHSSAPGDAGEGEIHSVRLERLRDVPKEPEGERLSLYDFNVHKMEDEWRGWIRFIKDQRLAPPDIVLLQDIADDAGRMRFEDAMGEAFGGHWAGRGSDPAWQVAVVWRSGRFSQAQSRVWRGFGGEGCVDGSQDAPALQLKLRDDAARKWISVVSLKTPPGVADECVWKNMQKVDGNFDGAWRGDLCVIGTDANSPDRDDRDDWARWYRRTIRSEAAHLAAEDSLGFCDPVADECGRDRARMEDHLTLGKMRIDFLMLRTGGRKAPRVVRQMTLPRGNVDGVKWSDHRSVHAEVVY